MPSEAQQPYAPLVETQTSDAPVAQQTNIPAAENYAADEDVKQFCQNELYGIVTRIKSRRKPMEDEWLAIQRLRTLTHDGGQKYKGRSNVYMPNYATAHATILSTLSRGLFPSDDYMDVEPNDFGADEAAEQVKSILKYEFDCNARLRAHLKPALSQLVDHGNCVIKYWYRTGKEFKGKKGKGKQAQFQQKPQKGLTVSARSIFNVVVYPETAEDEKDILITAEYIDIDRNFALALAKSRRWLNAEEALAVNSNTNDQSQYSRDQTLIDQAKIPGMTENVDNSPITEPTAQLVTCIEAYVSMRLPASAYVEGEDKTQPIPARVVMFKGIPVEVTRNQNFEQEHPYLWSRQGVVPGCFYGSWCGRRARYLQYMINDLANQTNDTGIYALNPFMVVDTNLLTGPMQPLAPGRIFRTRDAKNAITFNHPPMEPIQYGQQLMSAYIGALMDTSGAPPVLQGIGKSEETATGQSILQRNSLSPLQDVIEDTEAQMMVPLMQRSWRLVVQFTDRPIVVKLQDGSQHQVEVADLDEWDYNFKFLASSQAANQSVRAQQAIQLLAQLPATVPLLQANGYMVNPAPILRRLYSDGFGWRQFDQFVFKLPPQPMMPGAQPQGAPGQELQPGSATHQEAPPDMLGAEQNAPIPQELQGQQQDPQATDDFSPMRTIIDEMNAMQNGKAGV